jgi:hypothetical protein
MAAINAVTFAKLLFLSFGIQGGTIDRMRRVTVTNYVLVLIQQHGKQVSGTSMNEK